MWDVQSHIITWWSKNDLESGYLCYEVESESDVTDRKNKKYSMILHQ